MPLARRLELLGWAGRTGAYVIEDDYDSEFRYGGRPVEAIQALDRSGRVIYMGTFSKTMFPALRIGYLVLPPALVEPFTRAKWRAARRPSERAKFRCTVLALPYAGESQPIDLALLALLRDAGGYSMEPIPS